MLLDWRPPTRMGSADGRIGFGEEPKAEGAWAGRRVMFLDEKPAFELSFWCGTCQFLFERLEGANDTVSLDVAQDRLNSGLARVDDEIVAAFASLLETGDYAGLLLEIEPTLIVPFSEGDYFGEEQVTTWGLDAFWGLPVYPHTPYYRTFQTAVDASAHLYEFVVPMVPPSWNDQARVAEYEADLAGGALPTAVAVSILDVCAPAVDTQSTDYHAHWGLTHFLLDGHHKLEAAFRAGRPMRLLSLLSTGAGLASEDLWSRIPDIRRRPDAARPVTR